MPGYEPLAKRLTRAQIALDNSQSDPILQEMMAAYGYDAARLQEGRTLLEAARNAQAACAAEYGDQYAATDELSEALEEAQQTYMRHLQVARIAFSDDREVRRALELDGRRKQTLGGWLKQARLFYKNALVDAEAQAALEQFGVTREDLLNTQAKVEAVETANAAQEREKGEAQKATEKRDLAVDALDAWMSDFRAIARIAFEEDPQQLEKLTITAR